jgi:hypothetical protein
VQRPPRIVQLVFEPIDFLPQTIAFLLMTLLLAFKLASEPFVLPLLAFQFGDQLVARGRAPARLHTLVMPRRDRKYKGKPRCSCRSDEETRLTTR